ncbi:zincin-like metallopeptidase domain-containing protein [Herbaspirillum sp. ST 5-3]|uniref:ArdC family protein n=1 Tax=Oxalobacteraceae TaxID=75682 RepID=UPI0010A58A3B|nr:zincin-like metallopeptidase domain-containing protein [Herbaspirillum sp. ST 5-3]
MAWKKQYEQKEKRDYQQELTNKFIEFLESSEQTGQWQSPFQKLSQRPYNAVTGEPYKNTNSLALAIENYADPRWLTFVQIKELSEKLDKPLYLKKGSEATFIQRVIPAYAKNEDGEIIKDADGKAIILKDENGKDKFGLKPYAVYNASQIVGIDPLVQENKEVKTFEAVEFACEAMMARTGLNIEHSARTEAYYSPSQDKIHMPLKEYFRSSEDYAMTKLHELGHATGKALGRDQTGRFGSADYAFEELVAEMSAAYLGQELSVPYTSAIHDNQKFYLKSWISALKNDKKFLFNASSLAAEATKHVTSHVEAYKQDLKQKQTQGEGMEDIKFWLESNGIEGYTINQDLTVDVNGSVNLANKDLMNIPVQFGKVSGDFDCSGNSLTSLKGCPREVGENFYCADNKISTLKWSPEKVGGDYCLEKNMIRSLEGCPKTIEGTFNCSNNILKSLEACPQKVGEFICNENHITSLEGGPQNVSKDYYCMYNQLSSLKGSPKEINGHFYCAYNVLDSLKDGPQSVSGDFVCQDNYKITSLEGAPTLIGGRFKGDKFENEEYLKFNQARQLKESLDKNLAVKDQQQQQQAKRIKI